MRVPENANARSCIAVLLLLAANQTIASRLQRSAIVSGRHQMFSVTLPPSSRRSPKRARVCSSERGRETSVR